MPEEKNSSALVLPPPAKEDMTRAATMKREQWTETCDASRIFYGWIAEAPNDDLYVKRALQPAFALKEKLEKPDFVVEDSSYISVEVTSSKIEDKLVWKGFSQSGLKSYIAGGAYGFTLGLAGEIDWDKEDTSELGTSASNSKLHCTYNFPRVTVYMSPQSIELSEPCKSFLEKMKEADQLDKNDLTEFFFNFGGMLPTKISLGGRLYTAKISHATDVDQMRTQKRELKKSMGVNFMSPYGGLGLGGHRNKGEEKGVGHKGSSKGSTLSITAQGGNSLVSWSPPDWALSVGSCTNWRAIYQDGPQDLIPFLLKLCQGGDHSKREDNNESDESKGLRKRLEALNSLLIEEERRHLEEKRPFALDIGNRDEGIKKVFIVKGIPRPGHHWTLFVKPHDQPEIIRLVRFIITDDFPNPVVDCFGPRYEHERDGWGTFEAKIRVYPHPGFELRELDGEGKGMGEFVSGEVDSKWNVNVDRRGSFKTVNFEVRRRTKRVDN